MQLKSRLILPLVIFLVAGCAVQIKNQQSVTTKVERYYDEFTKVITYWGPGIDRQGKMQKFAPNKLQASRNEKSKNLSFSLYIDDSYDGEARFYESAYDHNGNRLAISRLDIKLYGCSRLHHCTYSEYLRMDLSLDYLRRHENKGMKFQIRGEKGSAVIEVPGLYIKGFLAALSELN